MADPMPFAQLDYTPTHGSVAMRGRDKEWNMDVSVEQGRAMEADGIPVFWIMNEADWPKGGAG